MALIECRTKIRTGDVMFDNSELRLAAIIVGMVLCIFSIIFFDAQLEAARYYECVYTIKGASVSPADIQVICER